MNTQALARLLASQHNLDTWSQLGPKAPRKDNVLRSDFSSQTTSSLLHSFLNDYHIRWVFIDKGDSVGVAVSLWISYTTDDVEIVAFSASDDLYAAVPTCFDFHAMSQQVLSLLSKDDASVAGFDFLSFPPPDDTINKPGIIPLETNSIEELGFASATGDALPVFTLIPKLLPIPPGYHIPEGHCLADPLPILSGSAEYWQPFAAWYNAQRFLLTKNDGNSDNSPGNNELFTADNINVAALYPNAVFSPTVQLIVNPLCRSHPSYHRTRELTADNANALVFTAF
jgi:hypothetical protein